MQVGKIRNFRFVFQSRGDAEDEKQGEIKHIYRSYAFVMSRKHMENGGLFVCKPRHLLLVGSKANTKSKPYNKMNCI